MSRRSCHGHDVRSRRIASYLTLAAIVVPALIASVTCVPATARAEEAASATPQESRPGVDKPRQYRPTSVSFPDSEGKQFFRRYVLPALAANGCITCHTPAPGDVHPAIQYEQLLPYLAMGQSATDNILMLKLANLRSFGPQQPAHVGGQRCASVDAEPCKKIQAWWRTEFGAAR